MKLRSATTALILAAALAAPAALEAQFTTFVAPPRKTVTDSAKPATVAQVKARSDSVARMSITNMKEWVDSAAGVNTTVAAATDTTMASPTATAPSAAPVPNGSARSTTAFSNGAIAPNTASPLPLYLATGFASLSAGLVLLIGLRRRAAAPRKI